MHYENVPVSNIVTDKYQRPVAMSVAKKMAMTFNPNLVGTLIVSKRDGNYYVIDGQYRTQAALLCGVKVLPCLVHEGLTYSEEADLFVKYNRNRKSLQAFDYVKGLHEANDKAVSDMYSATECAGFQISRLSSNNHISAVSSALSIVDKYGVRMFAEILIVLKKAWDGNHMPLSGDVMLGVCVLFNVFGTKIDSVRLSKKLQSVTPERVLAEADNDPNGGPKKNRVARVLLKYYNKNMQVKLAANF